MDIETKRRSRRTQRHAERLARYTLDRAGSRIDVGRALDKDPSTISHEVRTRCNPTLAAAYEVLLTMEAADGTSVRVFADAVAEAVELYDIVRAETTTLIERGVYLLEQENVLDGLEDSASLRATESHAASLRTHAAVAMELAAIEDELLARRVDLLAVYRERAA